MNMKIAQSVLMATALASSVAMAGHHEEGKMKMGVMAKDQATAAGTVTADKVYAPANGWLVIHRTGEDMKPGPVVGHAPLKEGKNRDVTAILTEEVNEGDMLMLMVHGEKGGEHTGVFEYTLGATADGPIKKDGKLVMSVITAN